MHRVSPSSPRYQQTAYSEKWYNRAETNFRLVLFFDASLCQRCVVRV